MPSESVDSCFEVFYCRSCDPLLPTILQRYPDNSALANTCHTALFLCLGYGSSLEISRRYAIKARRCLDCSSGMHTSDVNVQPVRARRPMTACLRPVVTKYVCLPAFEGNNSACAVSRISLTSHDIRQCSPIAPFGECIAFDRTVALLNGRFELND